MTLLDQARVAQAANHRGPECRVSAVRSTLGAGLLDEFEALIAAEDVFATTASSILKSHSIALTPESIQRHRAARCKCDVAA